MSRLPSALCLLLSISLPLVAGAASGDDSSAPSSWLRRLKDNPAGSLYLKLRPRYEYANAEDAKRSHALTLRSVAGFGTRTWHGLSLLAEGESVLSADEDWSFDGTGTPTRRTLIADPPDANVNQLYLNYDLSDWTTRVRVGRQRLVLDDARFVGNVGWRQNEQTLDALFVSTGLGLRDLRLRYAYVDAVRRIFGDATAQPDFESRSHLVGLEYQVFEAIRVSLFAHLLELENSPLESSNSYGLRLFGERELSSSWILDYSASYARQSDAHGNPVDYASNYLWLSAGLAEQSLGRLSVGYEMLGSDDARFGFQTPLATLHGFNGYADVFTDNGGSAGLRDFFVSLESELPFHLEAYTAFHWFETDAGPGGRPLGWELDASLAKPITPFLSVIFKVAYFEGRDPALRPTTLRAWAQATFSF